MPRQEKWRIELLASLVLSFNSLERNLSTLFLRYSASTLDPAKPIIKDGEAQIVEAFNNPDKWIRHDLWVETTFDTDGDGKLDRMHVSVTRPEQTEKNDWFWMNDARNNDEIRQSMQRPALNM